MTKNLLKLLLVAVVLTLGTNTWALPVPDEDGGADGGWNYNITITCGDEPEPFASGIAPENSTVWVNFSRYRINFSGGLYEKKPVNNILSQAFTITEDNFTANVDYTQVPGVDFVFWGEGEYLFDTQVAENPNITKMLSGGSAGYVIDNGWNWLTSLMPGTYQIRAGVIGDATFTFRAGGKVILTATGSNDCVVETISEDFTLTEETDITVDLGGDAGSSTVVPKAIDYVLITKASEETDAVRTVAAQQQPAAVFNLAGQQMRRAQKGINIVGGKKLLVK